MPAKSKAQRRAAAIALAAKKGIISKADIYGASKNMIKMKTSELEKMASQTEKNLKYKVKNENIILEKLKHIIKNIIYNEFLNCNCNK